MERHEYVNGYGALLKESYAAIHDADRRAKVVFAGLTNFSWEALDELYEKSDIKGHFDVAALHRTPPRPHAW